MDQYGGRHVTERVAMGYGRQLRPLHIQPLYIHHLIVDRDRGHTHDSAAAFAVIPLCFYIILKSFPVLFLFKGGKTRASGSPSGIQAGNIQKPGVSAGICIALMLVYFLHGRFLRQQPVQISPFHIVSRPAADSAHCPARITDKKTVCCEKSHLCIIRNQCFPGQRIFFKRSDSSGPVF